MAAAARPRRGPNPNEPRVIYYNDNNPHAAEWLRQLISARLIPFGIVDDRSIVEVEPADLVGFRQCHFFAGIGGWALALALAGWSDADEIWSGSCPCQPFSQAGRKKKYKDPRNLWPHFHRLIKARRPARVIGEQVAGKAGLLWLARIRADLEALAYEVGAADLCGACVGSPQVRPRLWWVADSGRKLSRRRNSRREEGARPIEVWTPNQFGRSGSSRRLVDADSSRREKQSRKITMAAQQLAAQRPGSLGCWQTFETVACADGKHRRFEPGSHPLADGFPGRVGILRGYGNAIIPLLAAEFIKAYMETKKII